MSISVFDLYTIGIGPSSSHTVGPMRAARQFVEHLAQKRLIARTASVRAELYGSLALTGKGHGSDKAILLGLEGESPETVDVDGMAARLTHIRKAHQLHLGGKKVIPFVEKEHLLFKRMKALPRHPNGMIFFAFDDAGSELANEEFYSIGGGFVLHRDDFDAKQLSLHTTRLPHPFKTGDDLLVIGRQHGLRIDEIMLANEKVWRSEDEIRAGLLKIWAAMQACIERGMHQEGTLPGGLKVTRRAPGLRHELVSRPERSLRDPLTILDWVNLYALAVNEENAGGGRVVTAPTNGAAGIMPAVLSYYARFAPNPTDDGVIRFLLAAGAIALLYKENASISGAEVGCQGEVGVACSMAAGGLVAALGGTNEQVENAAEIGMEHNLGLTCDPIGGLVQIPCIERNAMGSVKAINAARLSLRGDGSHMVTLDQVIRTMRITGADMKTKYKETSRGGLAVSYIEC